MITKKHCLAIFLASSALAGSAFAQQWGEIDRLQDFTERQNVVVNATIIDKLNLKSHTTSTIPWSDTFWPDYRGSIASPYADGILLWPLGWGPNKGRLYGRLDRLMHNFDQMSQTDLDNLAPSEKFDYLLGDHEMTFTKAVLARVQQASDWGLTALWSGVCHGWTAASLKMPRPMHAFEITAANGRKVKFFPGDVKGLETFLWGQSYVQGVVKSEGWRCDVDVHANKRGRLVDPRCFDVNPAFFHLAAVNLIGLEDRGFVMDRNYQKEVQNQPVYSYRFSYFDPTERHPVADKTFEQARVSYRNSFRDPYRNYRSPQATGLVGVEMTVKYAFENGPDHYETDKDRPNQRFESKDYTTRYDLELDDSNNIVGGEWREFDDANQQSLLAEITFDHPDVIWLPGRDLRAQAYNDVFLTAQWDGKGVPPAQWLAQARYAQNKSSANVGIGDGRDDKLIPQPLSQIVEMLVARSRE